MKKSFFYPLLFTVAIILLLVFVYTIDFTLARQNWRNVADTDYNYFLYSSFGMWYILLAMITFNALWFYAFYKEIGKKIED